MTRILPGIRYLRIPWLALFSAAVLLFLFAPTAIIILFSFNDSPALSFPIRGLSLRWYHEVLNSAHFHTALENTVIVGTITSLATMVIGTLAALGLSRYRFRLKPVITAITVLPIALPALFIGLALLSYFSLLRIRLSLFTVVVGHLIYTLPYFVLVANTRLERFDTAIEEAARDLGATAWQTFWRVTFPIIAPSIIGAGILVFALSFDEFLISFFVIGAESTLPMLIWSMMRRSLDPRVNVISTIVLGVSLILITFMSRLVEMSEITL
jgi:ABC-type spermidine/putrescine transport system permease subunit II